MAGVSKQIAELLGLPINATKIVITLEPTHAVAEVTTRVKMEPGLPGVREHIKKFDLIPHDEAVLATYTDGASRWEFVQDERRTQLGA